MTLPRGAVAHDNCTSLLASDDTIAPIICQVLIVNVLVIPWLRRRASVTILLIVLSVITSLLLNRIIGASVVSSRGDWRVCVLLILSLEMLRILSGQGIGVLTPMVAIHFCLSWGSGIGHGDVVGSWPDITDGTILWHVLRACVGIRGAASSPPGEFRGNIGSRLLAPVTMILLIANWLRRSQLLGLSLLASIFKSPFKAVLHSFS